MSEPTQHAATDSPEEQALYDQLVQILAQTVDDLDPDDVTIDSSLNDLGIDSLARLEVVTAIEEQFAIKVPEEDADRLTTVRETFDYLNRALATDQT
ncbi:acyl carrier protein [Streptomyces sp. NBC_00237]|uniref:acyl carrier protein n=1 Tax=Streptomyces sp. NBC_00237 TaxID=2975687 RepID=UPI00224E7961|nr:acyl carrier protein [Streptomyces sp. NBC_00237]MCX5205969.1 acyl carrier protein [Streptomyces sp. NBC_00237]